jgi:hypothetical protein
LGLSPKKQTSTQNTQSTNTASYDYRTPPSTSDIDVARASTARVDPSIGYRLGEKERQLSDSFNNPTGGYTTPQMKDAILRAGRRDLMQQAGEQTREGQYDVNRINQSKNLALAGLTAPQLVQTGSSSTGSGTGTIKQSESPWGTLASVGASAAPLSL